MPSANPLKRDYFSVIFFLIFALIICFKIVFNGEVIFTGDNFNLLFPQKHFLVEEVKQGRFPLWNPYILSGTPYLADINLGTLAPTNLIYFLIKPIERAASYLLVFELFLIGFLTYLCARIYKVSYISSIISGVIFMCSGTILAYVTNLSILNVIVFLPIVFYFLEKALNERSYKLVIICAILFALQIISGHAQITYYTGFLIAALIFLNNKISSKSKIKISILIFSIALTLSSIQLFPFIELAKLTPRFNQNYEWATQGSLGFIDLIKFLTPKFMWSFTGWVDFSSKANIGYIGVIPFLLMLIAFFSKERRFRILSGFILISVILALGRNTPLYRLFYTVIPGLSLLKVPSQIISIYSFVGALLAGKGLDLLREKINLLKISKRKSLLGIKFLIFTFLVVFILSLLLLKNINLLSNFLNSYKLAVFAINLIFSFQLFTVFLIVILLFRIKRMFLGIALILTSIMLDSFLTTQAVLLTSPLSEIKENKEIRLPDFDKSLYRIYTVPPEQVPKNKVFDPSIEKLFAKEKSQLLLPNQNIYQKFLAIDGYASMAIASYINQFTDSTKTTTGLGKIDLAKVDLQKAAVRFIVSHNVYEVSNSRKRYFLENLGNAVLLNENPLELNFLVESFQEEQKFVLLDSYYPDWFAFIDNQEVYIAPFEKVYRSITVPVGMHLITFKFLPKTIVYGGVVSIIAILTTGFLYIFLKEKKF